MVIQDKLSSKGAFFYSMKFGEIFMHRCRHLTLKLLKSGETNPRAISLPSAIVRSNLRLEFSSLLNDRFSVTIIAGLVYAT